MGTESRKAMLHLRHNIWSQEQLGVLELGQLIRWHHLLQRLWHVALQRALKRVGHNRAHHGHTNSRPDGAEECEAGREKGSFQ